MACVTYELDTMQLSGNFYWRGLRQRIDIFRFVTFVGDTTTLMDPIWRSIRWWNQWPP